MKKKKDRKGRKDLTIAGAFPDKIDINAHRKNMRTEKIQRKGQSTTNPHEKDAFLRKAGPQMPGFVKKKTKKKKYYS